MNSTAPVGQFAGLLRLVRRLFVSVIVVGSLTGPAFAETWFVAPDGNDAGQGTIDEPFATLQHAHDVTSPGDTVFIRGGTYRMRESQIAKRSRIWAHVIALSKSGREGNPIRFLAYQDEKPVFDFSDVKPNGYRVHAFSVTGSWLHLRGIEVIGVQVTIRSHTQSIGFANDGSHNVFERLSIHDGHAIGIYAVRGSHNLFLNCDAYRNHDPVSENGRGGNVDGFGCHPTPGSVGNVFRGCRAWFNSDDGFDCISAFESVTFENCWAFYNGYSPTFESLADGNGFKVGGFASTPFERLPSVIPRHVVRFCVAVKNRSGGFYNNHHLGGSDWVNNTAMANGVNYNMLSRLDDNVTDVPGYDNVLRNNLSYQSRNLIVQLDRSRSELACNSFDEPFELSEDDFQSLDMSELTLPRHASGDLPMIRLLRPRPTSPLVDAGVETGAPFSGKAPDIGALESASDTDG